MVICANQVSEVTHLLHAVSCCKTKMAATEVLDKSKKIIGNCAQEGKTSCTNYYYVINISRNILHA